METFLPSLILLTLTFSVIAENNDNPCGLLYLTQSPHKKKNLQLNWNFNCTDPPDTILLTAGDIKENPNAITLHRISPRSITKGSHESDISLDDVKFPGNWAEHENHPNLKANCFNFYISSVRNNEVLFSQCLSIQPAWMSNFGDLRIGDMMIPGTHNSGAFTGVFPVVRDYVLNQDKDFYQQLVYGIRYFDIRIGRYGGSPEDIYINHALFKCAQLLPELQGVMNFLRQSPKEVVILNFHMFPLPQPFTRNHHSAVLSLINGVLGDLIFPYDSLSDSDAKGPKLKDFWSSGRRVIVSYNNEQMRKEFPWLWPSVNRLWGNKQRVKDLEAYIKGVVSKSIPRNPMHVLMAELTPILHSSNLKDSAVAVNRELSNWVIEKDLIHNLNIIATDFFTGNDMINMAIETNHKKLNKL